MRPLAGAILGLAILLAGCASDSPQPQPNDVSPPLPPPSEPVEPTPEPPPSVASNTDQCGAADFQKLVGRRRSEIPVPVLPALQRVACTTCPVTQDYNPRRLNFFFDAETGIIKEVRCG